MEPTLYGTIVGDFGPIITLIVVITVAVIAVFRFGIRFDVNQYLEARKDRSLRLARLNCTHLDLEACEDGIKVQSLFYSPPGTLDWMCNRCGVVTHVPPDDEQIRKAAEYYINNPDEYKKSMNRFAKYAKRSY